MINRIISNLPFKPSLIEELSFYSKRLQKERSVRRLGFIMILLSMLVQIFAATAPAQKSFAASDNDVIRGGIDNMQQLRNKYNNQADVRGLYQRFGLDIDDLRDGGGQPINFGFQYQGGQGVRTVGRINFSYTNDQSVGQFAGTQFWSRSASEWQGSEPAYAFGRQLGTDGRYYLVWVLKNCGNIAYLPTQDFNTGLGNNQPVAQPNTGIGNNQPVSTPDTPAVNVTPTPTVYSNPVPVPEVPGNISIEKSAINITQDLNPIETTQIAAKAGDIIEYTLITKTTDKKPFNNYKVEDYIGDVLDYADLDMKSVTDQGGKYSASSKKVIWENQTVPAESSLTKTFRVNVKKKIPKTNSPNVTAPDFDCKMQNGYGNEVTIKIDCPVIKTVEKLPNTGPGSTVAITFSLMSISGYFLARNGLLGKELFIIRRDYAASGGK